MSATVMKVNTIIVMDDKSKTATINKINCQRTRTVPCDRVVVKTKHKRIGKVYYLPAYPFFKYPNGKLLVLKRHTRSFKKR